MITLQNFLQQLYSHLRCQQGVGELVCEKYEHTLKRHMGKLGQTGSHLQNTLASEWFDIPRGGLFYHIAQRACLILHWNRLRHKSRLVEQAVNNVGERLGIGQPINQEMDCCQKLGILIGKNNCNTNPCIRKSAKLLQL